jgi:hypothetical protein
MQRETVIIINKFSLMIVLNFDYGLTNSTLCSIFVECDTTISWPGWFDTFRPETIRPNEFPTRPWLV